jgi:hypothetical protein
VLILLVEKSRSSLPVASALAPTCFELFDVIITAYEEPLMNVWARMQMPLWNNESQLYMVQVV